MFLFKLAIVRFRFQPLIFTGVPVSESQRFFPPRAGDDGLIQPAVVVEERWVPNLTISWNSKQQLGGGVKDFLFLPLFGEDSHFD